jgi:hypothetical protein
VEEIQATEDTADHHIFEQRSTILLSPEGSPVSCVILTSPVFEVPESVVASEVPEATVIKAR